MGTGLLGRLYHDNKINIKQGESRDSMHAIQDGLVDILDEINGEAVRVALRGRDGFLTGWGYSRGRFDYLYCGCVEISGC